jgi:hypothetical protein
MPAAALACCPVDLSPKDWYALINAHVFFWPDLQRLNRQRRADEPRPHVVLALDADRMIQAHGERIFLTPIRTGNARRRAAQRGALTFLRYDT